MLPDEHLETVPDPLRPDQLAELPAGERLEAYKRYLKNENSRIRRIHDQGGGGCEIAALRSGVIDTLLRSLFQTARSQTPTPPALSLMANGGYGRGLLNPSSDIDLLFLLPQPSHRLGQNERNLVESILYPLFDLGFKVGHASRSINECLTEARRDPITRTSLFDHRLLCGNDELS